MDEIVAVERDCIPLCARIGDGSRSGALKSGGSEGDDASVPAVVGPARLEGVGEDGSGLVDKGDVVDVECGSGSGGELFMSDSKSIRGRHLIQ
jgi:hypothetical protein